MEQLLKFSNRVGWDIYTLSRASHISSSAVCFAVVGCCSLSFTSCHLSWELKRKKLYMKSWHALVGIEARAKPFHENVMSRDDDWEWERWQPSVSRRTRVTHTHIRVVVELFLPHDHWVVSEWSDFKKLLSLHQFHFTEEREGILLVWDGKVLFTYNIQRYTLTPPWR